MSADSTRKLDSYEWQDQQQSSCPMDSPGGEVSIITGNVWGAAHRLIEPNIIEDIKPHKTEE